MKPEFETRGITESFTDLENQLRTRKGPPQKIFQYWAGLFAEIAAGRITIPGWLIEKLQKAGGFSPGNLTEGLRTLCQGWAKFQRSPGEWKIPDKPLPRIAVVAAGNIPGIAVAPAVLLSCAGCPVIVKNAHSDQWVFSWLLELFRRHHPDICTGILSGYWPSGSPEMKKLLQDATRILVFGSDQTVAQFRQIYGKKIVAFGHKFSLGYASAPMIHDRAMKGFAKDIVLFDQSGCLSVQAIFVNGQGREVEKWAQRLAQKLDEAIATFGDSNAEDGRKLHFHNLKDTFDLLGYPYFHSDKMSWFVAIVPEFSADRLVGRNFVQMIPVSSVDAVLKQLNDFQNEVQGLALDCQKKDFSDLKREFCQFGFSYVGLPGEMQSPPIDWPNGGLQLPDAVLDALKTG